MLSRDERDQYSAADRRAGEDPADFIDRRAAVGRTPAAVTKVGQKSPDDE